jgi:hypothetical protein
MAEGFKGLSQETVPTEDDGIDQVTSCKGKAIAA